MLPNARDIARMVSAPQMLRHLGWRIRPRNRADCGLCKGSSRSTVAFTERLWRCHRCNEGGDVLSLVIAVHRCDFPTALRYVASFAGLRLEDSSSPYAQHEMETRQRQRERIDRAAETLAEIEHAFRIECRDRIHECDRVLHAPGPWSEAQWQRAKAASVLRDEYLLPAYTLLSFGMMAERAQYVLADWRTRPEMAAAVRVAGGVRTDSALWMGVIA